MAENSGWLLASHVIRLTVGFVTVVWLTRYLGPEAFGLYSYVISLVLIFAAVASVGMTSLVTRDLVETPGARNYILGSAVAIRLAGSLVATVLLVLTALAFHDDADVRFALVAFGMVLLVQPLQIVPLFYEAETKSRYVVWVQLPVAGLYLVMVAAMVTLELSVVWFLVARLAQTVLADIGVMATFWRQGYRPMAWRVDLARVRGLIREAWPLVFSAFGAVLYLRIDQVMLGQMTNSTEVGTYAAAARLSEIWYFVPGLIVASAFPYLLRLREADSLAYRRRLQQLFDVLAWLGVGVAVAITLAAPMLVGLLFGEEFAASTVVLRVHVWATVFIFMRAAFSRWLVAERLLLFSLVTQGAGAATNVLLNLVLIPVAGGLGAAWATVGSYAVASLIALAVFPVTRPAAAMMIKTIGAPSRLLRRHRPTDV
jgi:O-antigen/teichoic acid export membrane protein